jgi:hypothetical protein
LPTSITGRKDATIPISPIRPAGGYPGLGQPQGVRAGDVNSGSTGPEFLLDPQQQDLRPRGIPRPSPIVAPPAHATGLLPSATDPSALTPAPPPGYTPVAVDNGFENATTTQPAVSGLPGLSIQMQAAFEALMADARHWADKHSLALDLPANASAAEVLQWLYSAGYPGVAGAASISG